MDIQTYKMLAQNKDGKVHYKREGTFGESDVKKFYRYQFKVPEGTQEIQFIFDYSPRALEDPEKNRQLIKGALREWMEGYSEDDKVEVKKLFRQKIEMLFDEVYPIRNLLDVLLYDTEGNCVGNLASVGKVTWVNKRGASPGFTPWKIKPGMWMIEIVVASVVTKKCHYKMEILLFDKEPGRGIGVRKEEKIVARAEIEERETIVKGENRWYAGELHVHSNHSDGKNSIEEIIRKAKMESLDFFALTDHNVVSGYDSIPQDNSFPIIKGMEITTLYGHALALGTKSLIDWRRDNGEVRNINDVINEVHAQGALFSMAHPFCIGDPVCVGCRWKFKEIDYRLIDMIEVWCNSWRSGKIENYRSFKLWDKLLNEGLKVTGVSSRDWHDINKASKYGPIPKTFVYADLFTENKLLEGLRKGNVFVSSGPMAFFLAEYGNENYICGDEIEASAGKSINFSVKVENLQTFAQLKIIKNGLAFFKKNLSLSDHQIVTFSDILYSEKSGSKRFKTSWYRCEIYTVDEEKNLLCFTNPISIRFF